jgi:hypothetical protein
MFKVPQQTTFLHVVTFDFNYRIAFWDTPLPNPASWAGFVAIISTNIRHIVTQATANKIDLGN